MSGQYYPQQQEQPAQPYHPPHAYPVEKKGIETFFIAKDKIGLFLFLCAGMLMVGFLLLDLVSSGLVDYEEAIIFLGMIAIDVGIIVIIALILVSGLCRDDLPEKIRSGLIHAAAIVVIILVIVYIVRTAFTGFGGFY